MKNSSVSSKQKRLNKKEEKVDENYKSAHKQIMKTYK